jgi:hypothetical protein
MAQNGAVPTVPFLYCSPITVDAQGRISELIYLIPTLRNCFLDSPVYLFLIIFYLLLTNLSFTIFLRLL